MAVKLPKKQTYDPNSVVDTFKSLGMDSSYSARKEKATELGIKNYSGTEQQNIDLRNKVSNGASAVALGDYGVVAGNEVPKPKPNPKPKAKTEVGDAGEAVVETLDSVVPATPTAPTPVANAGVSQDIWDAINTPFTASNAYMEAMDYTNRLREQLSSGRTSYTDQIEKLMAQIQGRDKFSYDVSQDTLFQQSLASAMASGKTAMQDTIGQASALTGGYGSTYATSAGNQAYNGYIQDAYANLPEYYQMALEAYQMEGQEMYDQLGMLSTADATEYGRMYDAWNVNNTHAQNLYAQEYGAWQDTINNAFGAGNLQLNEQGQLFDQSSTLWAQDFQQTQADIDNEYRDNALKQDDEHYYAGLKQDDEHYYAGLEQDQIQYGTSMAHDQAQFIARYDVNGDGKVDSKDQTASGMVDENGNELKPADQKYKDGALEAWNSGGEDGLLQYISSMPSNIESDSIVDHVLSYGKAYGEDQLAGRTFTKKKDTMNGFLWTGNAFGDGIDGNDVVVDQYNNEYDIDDLPESIRKKLTGLKKGESWTYTA